MKTDKFSLYALFLSPTPNPTPKLNPRVNNIPKEQSIKNPRSKPKNDFVWNQVISYFSAIEIVETVISETSLPYCIWLLEIFGINLLSLSYP